MNVGSPPQVRGKLRPTLQESVPKRDHPRRCGENAVTLPAEISWMGSPPQVRGKPSDCLKTLPGLRITPAGAGKTSWDSSDLIPV